MESAYSLSDLASVVRDGDGFGAGNSSWVLVILFLLILWGGNGFNRNGQGELGQYATAASQQQILFNQQFDALGQKINAIGDGICSSTYALNNSILGEGRALQSQLASCCCENQRNTDALRYDMAQQIATVNATTNAQTQKILDAICQNKMETMQNQLNQLQLQNAVAGVVRYPMASTYTSGTNPFCYSGCGCGNI